MLLPFLHLPLRVSSGFSPDSLLARLRGQFTIYYLQLITYILLLTTYNSLLLTGLVKLANYAYYSDNNSGAPVV